MRFVVFLAVFLSCSSPPTPAPAESTPPSTAPAPEPSTQPTPFVEQGPPAPVERELGHYTTRFKANTGDGRVVNIELVTAAIGSFTLDTSQAFSFNDRVGPRTAERGYKDAPTLVLGEVQEGIGGGTCQVSSTLYALVLSMGLPVLERWPHSRVSSYVGPGLDATVNYPDPCLKKKDPLVCYDLRFKNPHDFPIRFEAKTSPEIGTDGKRALTITAFGTGDTARVELQWKSWATPPYETRFRTMPFWHNDRKALKQGGKPGLEGALHLKVYRSDGTVGADRVVSRYKPVPEVWEVGTEWKESK